MTYIGSLSATALADLSFDLGAATAVVTPAMFGAVGDNVADDMAAFQRASNFLRLAGGGTLLLDQPAYYMSEYTGADVDLNICGFSISGATVSKVWQIPSNVVVRAAGHTTLRIEGGTSSPFGYGLGVNVLAYTETSLVTAVTSATAATRSVVVSSAAGLSVGQTVMLSRPSGEASGIPNTPSREHAPCQFFTIKSIVSTTVTFEESFIHNYDSVQSLGLYRPAFGASDFTRNVHFRNITIQRATVSPYLLISRVIGSSADQLHLDASRASWGMSQDVDVGTMTLRAGDADDAVTVEAVCNMRIDSFAAEGDGSTGPLGALFFSDSCRAIEINDFRASNFTQTGMSAFYGVDIRANRITLVDCGTAATPQGGYQGALAVGWPASGAYPTLAVASAATYLVRNTGENRFHVDTLIVRGAVQVPVRVHDCAFSYRQAFLDFANPGNGGAPILVGQSGDRRADATHYPQGGRSSIDGELLVITTRSGAAEVVSTGNAWGGPFRRADTTTTSAVSAGATVIPVADSTSVKPGDVLRYLDLSGSSTTAVAVTVSSISLNDITVSAPLASGLVSGQGIWRQSTANANMTAALRLGRTILDGVEVAVADSTRSLFPITTAGGAPFTGTVTTQTPAWGDWELQVSLISDDNNHYVFARYQVTWAAITPAFPLSQISQISKNRVRSVVDVTSATIDTAGLVTINISSTTSGRRTRLSTRWVPMASVASYGV